MAIRLRPFLRPFLAGFWRKREQRDFVEEQHPRGPDGKFGTAGGKLPASSHPEADGPVRAALVTVLQKDKAYRDAKNREAEMYKLAGKSGTESDHDDWRHAHAAAEAAKADALTHADKAKKLLDDHPDQDWAKDTVVHVKGRLQHLATEHGLNPPDEWPSFFHHLGRADWDESAHPRAPDGKFGQGGGSGDFVKGAYGLDPEPIHRGPGPVMTRDEAQKWAADSKFPGPFYRGTSHPGEGAAIPVSTDNLSILGRGVYMAQDPAGLERYGTVVEQRARVEKPLDFYGPEAKVLAASPEYAAAGREFDGSSHGTWQTRHAAALQVAAQKQGYDSVYYRTDPSPGFPGGQVVLAVWDARKVATVKGEPARAPKLDKPELRDGWDESLHPRAPDGKFGTASSNHGPRSALSADDDEVQSASAFMKNVEAKVNAPEACALRKKIEIKEREGDVRAAIEDLEEKKAENPVDSPYGRETHAAQLEQYEMAVMFEKQRLAAAQAKPDAEYKLSNDQLTRAYLDAKDPKLSALHDRLSHDWVSSSSAPESMRLHAVLRSMGVPGTFSKEDSPPEKGNDSTTMKRYAREIYLMSQARLAEAGVDHVTLYRGVVAQLDGAKDGQKVNLATRPASSWTDKLDTAQKFADMAEEGEKGAGIVKISVPRSAVFSNYRMFGNLMQENEYVVLGAQALEAQVVAHPEAGEKRSHGVFEIDVSDTTNEDWMRSMRPRTEPPAAQPKPLERPVLREGFDESQHPRGPDGKFGAGGENAGGVVSLPKGLGIPRKDMPQIRSHDVPEFLEGLKAKGISVEKASMRVGDLKPTQSELNLDKVKALKGSPKDSEKPLLVSEDGHILDGHNRWAGFHLDSPDHQVPVYKIGLPIRKLIETANAFPKAEHHGVEEVGAMKRTDLESEHAGALGTTEQEDRAEFEDADHPRAPDGKFSAAVGAGGGAVVRPTLKRPRVDKGAARKAEILAQAKPADDVPHYHGTSLKNLDSILKSGIKPTDKSFGADAKTAWAATNEGLAHSYAAGSAAASGSDEYAMIVFKSGKDAGLKNFRGDKSAAFSFDTIPPDKIDRVEIYKADAPPGSKPARTLSRGPSGVIEARAEFDESQHPRGPDGKFASGGGSSGEKAGKVSPKALDVPQLGRRVAGRLAVPLVDRWVKSASEMGLPAETWERTMTGNPATDPTAKPHPERQALHDQIVNRALGHVPRVPDNEQLQAIMTMGGAASGKTSGLRRLGVDQGRFAIVDPDSVKEQMPEFRLATGQNATYFHKVGLPRSERVAADDAAAMAHEESSYIANRIREQAIAEHKHLVIDGTGENAEKFISKMNQLKAAGYHVRVVYLDLDHDEALRRAVARANKTGRMVPKERMAAQYEKIPGNFERISKAADEFAVLDSRPEAPKIVWRKDADGEHVEDAAFVSAFRKRHFSGGK